jgi:iron(III) transport system substrate-binding protein
MRALFGALAGTRAPARIRARGRSGTRLAVRGLLNLAAIAVLPLSVAACTSSSPSTASGQVTITLYNGQHVQTTEALVAAFEKATGINVAVRNDDEDVFDAEIVAEGQRSPADVIFSENSPALEYLQGRDLLAPVDRSTLARTPGKYNSPEGDWVGVSARVSVLIYNPGLIYKSALPTRVLELADPRYKGELAFAPGETDFQPVVTSVLRTYGKATALKWLDGIKTNAGGHVYPDNESISAAVNRGIVAFGVVNQYYWYRMRAEIGAANIHSRIAYFVPRDPGYVLDISGAGILKSSKHQAAAQRFLAFLVSEKGQEIIAHSISFEYPIASGVQTAQSETPFDELEPDPVDVGELGTGAQAIALLRYVQLL